ncbi:3-ketoacyl- synthase 20-like [Olea europaea subsp. europaea]|uniref:3-ketoacyl-CoA synthase n=1 Tax=Olea europaea subsp. europaea TaxID=158383 RepID=A0A8S0PVJ2_OLEEU|nr:3-ketoacyl- synthase 20-like [Olea europaea subsp. europaea]
MVNEQTNSKTGKIGVEANLPISLLYVMLKYVKLGYHYLFSHAIYLLIFLPLWIISPKDLFLQWKQLKFNLVTVVVCSVLMVLLGIFYFITRPRKVYLMDFACFKPKPELMCSKEFFMETSRQADIFTKENLSFQKKILERSGIGQKSYISEALFRMPLNLCISEAIKEAEMVMFGAIDDLFSKTAVKAEDIGILVVNCSLFSPTPSLSAMVVNHYKLRCNIVSYNLGGMGCSAGLISIDLAKQLLQVHPNSYALVVTMENMTLNWYIGNNRPMLVTNCLFRMGGAAILLSNKSSDRRHSKYHLIHTVRTHKGANEKSYGCVLQEEDDIKKIGVSLSKDLMAVAGESLKTNITTLGPLVLPVSEQLLFFVTLVASKVLKMKIRPYVPDFKLAIEHFCIHAGGRAVLDELEKNLELSEWHMEPSRMTLHRFGNTSSSSLWYELAYSEAKGRIRRGDRTWQIAFGSGFKCNSAVWRALRTIDPAKEKNPWMEEINDFPVEVPRVAAINN